MLVDSIGQVPIDFATTDFSLEWDNRDTQYALLSKCIYPFIYDQFQLIVICMEST